MRRLVTGLCMAAAIVAFGCRSTPDTSPPVGQVDPVPPPYNDPKISVLAPELREWVRFQQPVVINDGVRPMHVEVPVRNLAERTYHIDYRFLFYDDRGVELPNAMGWTHQPLLPKQIVRLRAGALDPAADDWRLEVKWAR